MLRLLTDRAADAMRMLVVEDDPTLADFVAKGLREAGFVVDTAADGRQGLDLAADRRPDLAVVDVMLPGLDGLGLIEALRHRGLRCPVLILSARRSVDDRVRGLQAGGDDYLTKPFAFAELLARVQVLLWRATLGAEPTTLQVGDLQIDLLARRTTRAGKDIDLRPREFALLEYLARNAGRVVSKTITAPARVADARAAVDGLVRGDLPGQRDGRRPAGIPAPCHVPGSARSRLAAREAR